MTIDEWEEYQWGMETVVPETPTEQSRWSTFWEKVVKDKEGNFWRLNWEAGSTECQDQPWEDTYHAVTQVYPKEVTKIEYVIKELL